MVRQAPSAFLPDTAVVVVAAILVGWISYSLIERPTSQLGGIFGRDGHLLLSATGTDNEGIEWESFRRNTLIVGREITGHSAFA
ncbi:MAG: hypothetical protein M3137_03285 [Actinomycetota bacterium]|nr:hypothetical protein [Actinomycetota bacterium]